MRKEVRFVGRLLLVGIVFFILFPGVGWSQKAPDVIKLGTTISLSGKFSNEAKPWDKLTEVYEEFINKKGGIYLKDYRKNVPIKIVYYDDKSDPATSVTMYERLAKVDNVDFFVGPDWSPIGFAASSVSERHKIPMVLANVLSEEIFTRGFTYIFGVPKPAAPKWSDNYFDLMVRQSPPAKTAALVVEDLLFTNDVANYATKKAESVGVKVVSRETFSSSLKDFSSIILKIKTLAPDILYIAAFEGPTVALLRQVKELDLNVKNIQCTHLSLNVVQALGKTSEYVTGVVPWWYGIKTPGSDLVEEMLKKSNIDYRKYVWTIARLDSYEVMTKAIELAGNVDREKVREAIKNNTFQTPGGTRTFQPNGLSNPLPGYVTQVVNQDMNVMEGPGIGQKLVYPIPLWKDR